MTDNTRGTIKGFVAGLSAPAPSGGWPACAACDHSMWIVDQRKPMASCDILGVMTFGLDNRFISRCEKFVQGK